MVEDLDREQVDALYDAHEIIADARFILRIGTFEWRILKRVELRLDAEIMELETEDLPLYVDKYGEVFPVRRYKCIVL